MLGRNLRAPASRGDRAGAEARDATTGSSPGAASATTDSRGALALSGTSSRTVSAIAGVSVSGASSAGNAASTAIALS